MTATVTDTPRWFIPTALTTLATIIGILAGLEPKLAIVASLAVAYLLIVIADLSLGIVFFALFTFLDLLPGLSSAVSFTKLAGLVLVVSWLAVRATRAGSRSTFWAEHPVICWSALAFLAWGAFSIVYAESTSVTISAVYRYGLNFLLLPIIFAGIRDVKDARRVIAAFIVGATISAAYGVVTQPSASSGLDRLSGTFGDPNELAAVLVAGLVLAGGMAADRSRDALVRGLFIGGAAACFFGVMLTVSRGGLISLGAAMIAAIILGNRARGRLIFVAVLTVLAALAYFSAFAPRTAVDRISNADGGSGRTSIWKVAERVVRSKPVTGLGMGNFQVASIHFLLQPGALPRSDLIVDRPSVVHNMYLEVAAEDGIPGLVLFLVIVGGCLGASIRASRNFARRRERGSEVLALSVAVAVIAVLAADFFLSNEFSKQLWLLLGLGPALQSVSRKPAGDAGAAAA